MEAQQQKVCIYKDESYAESTEVCLDDRCIVCKDGQWEDRGAGKLSAS